MITLTSFREAKKMTGVAKWSGARWAPDFAREWPVAHWAQPRDQAGPIRLRDFGSDPLSKYREYMLTAVYRNRWKDIKNWLDTNHNTIDGDDIALACWCPFTKTARKQIEQFGTFHCHLGVVAEVFEAAKVEWKFGLAHERGMVR